jgi:hypothetical protein
MACSEGLSFWPIVSHELPKRFQHLLDRAEHVLDESFGHVEDPRILAAPANGEPLAWPFFYASFESLARLDRPLEAIVKHPISVGDKGRNRFV